MLYIFRIYAQYVYAYSQYPSEHTTNYSLAARRVFPLDTRHGPNPCLCVPTLLIVLPTFADSFEMKDKIHVFCISDMKFWDCQE